MHFFFAYFSAISSNIPKPFHTFVCMGLLHVCKDLWRYPSRDLYETLFFASITFLMMDFNFLLPRLNSSFTSFLYVCAHIKSSFESSGFIFFDPAETLYSPFLCLCPSRKWSKYSWRWIFARTSRFTDELALISISKKISKNLKFKILFRMFLSRLSHDFSKNIISYIEIGLIYRVNFIIVLSWISPSSHPILFYFPDFFVYFFVYFTIHQLTKNLQTNYIYHLVFPI